MSCQRSSIGLSQFRLLQNVPAAKVSPLVAVKICRVLRICRLRIPSRAGTHAQSTIHFKIYTQEIAIPPEMHVKIPQIDYPIYIWGSRFGVFLQAFLADLQSPVCFCKTIWLISNSLASYKCFYQGEHVCRRVSKYAGRKSIINKPRICYWTLSYC